LNMSVATLSATEVKITSSGMSFPFVIPWERAHPCALARRVSYFIAVDEIIKRARKDARAPRRFHLPLKFGLRFS